MSTRRCNTVCVMRPSLPNKRRYENATVNGGEKSGRIEIVRKKLFPGTSGRVNARAKTNPRMQAVMVERTVITKLFPMDPSHLGWSNRARKSTDDRDERKRITGSRTKRAITSARSHRANRKTTA